MTDFISALILAAIPFTATPDDFGNPRWIDYEPAILDTPCADVARLDVRNRVFRLSDPAAPKGLTLRFRKGLATRTDDPDFAGGPPNWKTYLDAKPLARLHDGPVARFVLMSDVHDSSATERGYVLALTCAGGKAVRLFEAGGEGLGADLHRISEDVFRLHWLVWRKGDCHAQPSRVRIQTFSFRPAFGRFAIVGDVERDIRP